MVWAARWKVRIADACAALPPRSASSPTSLGERLLLQTISSGWLVPTKVRSPHELDSRVTSPWMRRKWESQEKVESSRTRLGILR